MQRLVPAGLILLAASAVQAAHAQGGIAGTWKTEFDIGIRNENGIEMSMGKREATLQITVRGDSIFGVWQAAAVEGASTPKPIALRGAMVHDSVSLVSEPVERTLKRNDDEFKVKMVTAYRFVQKGNLLEGITEVSSADDDFHPPPRAFKATRSATP